MKLSLPERRTIYDEDVHGGREIIVETPELIADTRNNESDFQSQIMDEPIPFRKVIADEMTKLSLQEREKAYEDIHGVSDIKLESPTLIADTLKDLNIELDLIKNKVAYDRAKELSENFVSDKKFRLGFLRAESFNASEAAARMVRYFEEKFELFGPGKLVKHIKLEDLNKEAVTALENGSLQVLTNRDSLGRAVVVALKEFHIPRLINSKSNAMMKMFWYVLSALQEDEESQKNGIVFISFTVGSENLPQCEGDFKLWRDAARNTSSLPIRISAFHYCYKATINNLMLSVLFKFLCAFIRVRMRDHEGSNTECQNKLMSFGIPMKNFPLDKEGRLKIGKHLQWIERRKQKEMYLETNNIQKGATDLPTKFDVLLGRGRPCQEHVGNQTLREWVSIFYKEYNAAARDEKTMMASQIVAFVHKTQGRFLQKDNDSGMWVPVSDKNSRDKVAHSFRRKRESEAKTNKNMVFVKAPKSSVNGAKRMKAEW